MIHPLFRLIASEPHMVVDHLAAYTDLVGEELAAALAQWKRQAIAAVVIGVCLLLAVLLTGVSLMLWAATPPPNLHAPWILWAVPAAPALLAVAAFFAARPRGGARGFDAVKAQFAADAAMLHSVSEP